MEMKFYTCPICGNKEHHKASLLGKADPNRPLDAFVCIKCKHVAFFLPQKNIDPVERHNKMREEFEELQRLMQAKQLRVDEIKHVLMTNGMGALEHDKIQQELNQLEQELEDLLKRKHYYINVINRGH